MPLKVRTTGGAVLGSLEDNEYVKLQAAGASARSFRGDWGCAVGSCSPASPPVPFFLFDHQPLRVMYTVKQLTAALEKGATFLKNRPMKRSRSETINDKMSDIVVGVLDLADHLIASDKLQAWIAAKPRRAKLAGLQPEEALWSVGGRTACCELLRLVAEHLQHAPKRARYPAGVLPIGKPRQLSSKQQEKMQEGKAAKQARSEAQRAERLRIALL
ncbi:MAG: hypothetical protein KDA75_13130 [Planctomycetaceae bacterium]|nr:hypothetical protein [Planctomycetaceae bacterium]